MSSPDPAVVTERIGAVCRLTLNRPTRHNPLTPRCIREILEAVASAEGDPGVRSVVIRGSGPSFSSGYGILPDDIEPGDEETRPGIEGDVAAMARAGRRMGPGLELPHPGHRPGPRQLPGRRAPTSPCTATSSSPPRTPASDSPRSGRWGYRPPTCGSTTWAPNGPSDCCSPATP